MIPHFFKLYSRFGIINPPYKWKEINYGVEKGPDTVLSEEFLRQFPKSSVSRYVFPNYEDIEKRSYRKVLAKALRESSEFIDSQFHKGEQQIVVGGDHSVTFPSFAAVLKRFSPAKVGYIQFDSQGDIHTFASSHSGNFHGMFVRAFVDIFDDNVIDALIPKKIPFENVLFVGNLDLEIEETEYFAQKKIRNMRKEKIKSNKENVLYEIQAFTKKFEHLHITFDVDVFDRSLVSATGTPAPDGWSKNDIFSILHVLNKHASFSFDLVEVNPIKPHAKSTVSLAQEVLSTMLM